MKNTTGYSLNALVDFTDPIDILAHLMIGSEGTLGFLSEITYRTVPDYADKASALILFDDLETACRAVTLLKGEPVAAVELADRAALRSVEGKPGLPKSLHKVGPQGAALLVETRAPDPTALAAQVRAIEAALAGVHTYEPVRFSTDAQECARYWNVRKGMFPSVGAMRKVGTTVIIEDVAFPVSRLAEATLDLQRLLAAHGYPDAIIFGHALEGNLHFVFTQDFNAAAEVARYRGFMDALCKLVVDKYDGSLKAEHGTGRNVAPFVELEWGAEAYALMREIKRLFDPQGLLNPGVILNDDPRRAREEPEAAARLRPDRRQVHRVRVLRAQVPVARAHAVASAAHRRLAGDHSPRACRRGCAATATLRSLYDYHGIDTCAACGLCATACPVGIETGLLIKALRGRRTGPLAQRVAATVAGHYAATTSGVRAGLAAADVLHGLVGTRVMQRSLDGMRRASGGRIPKWSPALPRAVNFRPGKRPAATGAARVVYFPSCAARSMGAQRGDDTEPVPVAAERLFRKAGFDVIYPEGARGALLRPAVREQGPGGGGRHEVGGAGARVARGQRQRAMADRVRHQSMRVSDATLLPRPACGPGQHRVHPRYGAAASRDRACGASRSSCIRCAACARWARWTS